MYTKPEKATEDIKALSGLMELLLSLEKKKIAIWESELAGMPEGNLHLLSHPKKTFFQITINGRRQGITRDIDLVYKLARKRYLQVLLKERKETIKNVHRLSGRKQFQEELKRKRSPLENLLKRYGKAGLTILRITCSEKQYRWAIANYRKNTFKPEELKYETYSGIKVRSKSEQSIGNALEERGIPYRYEMELNLKVDWMDGIKGIYPGGYKNYYPDFVILLPTGELLIWEHLPGLKKTLTNTVFKGKIRGTLSVRSVSSRGRHSQKVLFGVSFSGHRIRRFRWGRYT